MPGGAALGALPDSLSVVGGGAVDDALRRMTEGPRLADVGACERLVATVTQRWLSVQRSARESESVLAAAWAQANTRFVEKLTTRAGTRTDIPDAKATLELWLETANEVLLETHRSPKFLDAQRQLLRSGMDFMLAERALVEAFAEPAGLPTRTEIDEIHRSVHDLKRRVRRCNEHHRQRRRTGHRRSPRTTTRCRARRNISDGEPDSQRGRPRPRGRSVDHQTHRRHGAAGARSPTTRSRSRPPPRTRCCGPTR